MAMLACHIPMRFTARKMAGAGITSANDAGTTTISAMDKKSVMLGLITRK